MPRVNIAHIGDAQLGKKQYGIPEREEDFRRALTHCFTAATEQNVDVLVLPGDIFDSSKPSPANVAHLAKLARNFEGKVVGIDGNHDGTSDGSWLEACGVINLNKTVTTVRGVTFAGISSCRPNVFKEALSEMVEVIIGTNRQKVDVFVLHQSVAEMCGFTGVELTAQWIAEQLKMIGVKYVAMGDIHEYSLKEFDGITFCYPGSCEVTSLNENQEKYWVKVVLDTDSDQLPITEKMRIPTRPLKGYRIHTQDELTSMITDVRRNYQDYLVLVEISTDLPVDSSKAVYRMLSTELGVFTRITPFNPTKEETMEVTSIPVWERAEANNAIESAISQFHKPSTHQYQLIVNLLNNPQSVPAICQGWINDNT